MIEKCYGENIGFLVLKPDPPYKELQVYRRPPDWSLPMHCHQFHQIIVVTGGSLKITTESGPTTVQRGDIHFLPAGYYHELYSEHGYSQLGIDIDNKSLVRSISPMLDDYICAPIVFNRLDLIENVKAIENDCLLGDRFSMAHAIVTLDMLILQCVQSMISVSAANFGQRMSEYLNRNLDKGTSLIEIAKIFNISIPQLERLTRKYFQNSVIGLYNQLRLSRACLLLESTELMVQEIAQNVGFLEQSHFSAFFRRQMGVSPSTFRQQRKHSDKLLKSDDRILKMVSDS